MALWGPPDRAKELSGLGAISGLDPDSVRRALKPSQRRAGGSDQTYKNLLLRQCRFNPDWDEWTPLWLLRLTQLYPAEARETLLQRLANYPGDLAARRLLFDFSDRAGRGELCQDIMARLAMEQDRSDDQYLLTFCLPSAERLPHLRENLERFPNSIILASALGRVEFDRGDYEKALATWVGVLRAEPKFIAPEMDNLARLERRMGKTGFEIYDDVGSWVPAVAKKAVYELGVDPNERDREPGPEKAYFYLANGRVDEAVSHASGEFRDEILPLAAASEGADPALMDEFLAAPPGRGLTADNAWTALAVLAKAGRDSQKAEALILSQAVDRGLAEEIIRSVKARDAKKTEELAVNLDARLLGQACLAAYLVAPDQAEAEGCRAKAKGFLFSSERPYLK
jgi:tetratricopeptide (TPR) repeat protein